jgi:RHS repeat-associated protein
VRTNPGTLAWLASDSHGTGELAIDAGTLAATRRKTDPFGNPRGTPPAWPTTHGYVNGPTDPTGLTHLGAREYDPGIGRFISVDPILNPANPIQMNGYAYANNNPATASDPDGQICLEVCGGPDDRANRARLQAAKRAAPPPPPPGRCNYVWNSWCAPLNRGGGGATSHTPGPGISGPPGSKDVPTVVAVSLGDVVHKRFIYSPHGLIPVCMVGTVSVGCGSPAIYAEKIVEYARDAGVDPRLLLAILLQEGRAADGHGQIEKWAIKWGYDTSRGIGNMGEATFIEVRRGRSYSNADWAELSDNPDLAIRASADYLHDLSSKAADKFSGTAAQLRRDELIGAGYRSGVEPVEHMSRGVESAATRSEMLQYAGYINQQWAVANNVICGSGAFTCSQ